MDNYLYSPSLGVSTSTGLGASTVGTRFIVVSLEWIGCLFVKKGCHGL